MNVVTCRTIAFDVLILCIIETNVLNSGSGHRIYDVLMIYISPHHSSRATQVVTQLATTGTME